MKFSNFKFQISNSSKGFTLIELLIYIGLLGIFFGVLTEIFLSTLDIRSESNATSPLQQDGSFIVSRISYDMYRAQSIVLPASQGVAGNTLQLTIGATNYIYSLSGNNVNLAIGAAPAQNLNSSETSVTSGSFTRIGNNSGRDTIRINLTLASAQKRNGYAETKTIQTTVGLRQN